MSSSNWTLTEKAHLLVKTFHVFDLDAIIVFNAVEIQTASHKF